MGSKTDTEINSNKDIVLLLYFMTLYISLEANKGSIFRSANQFWCENCTIKIITHNDDSFKSTSPSNTAILFIDTSMTNEVYSKPQFQLPEIHARHQWHSKLNPAQIPW